MNKIVLLIFLISQISFGQDYYNDKGEFHFKQVFEVDKDQEEIYTIVKKWIATNFKDSKEVLQLDTKGNIVCKGNFKFSNERFTDIIDFTMDVAIKDNRYKIEVYDLSIKGGGPALFWSSDDPSIYTREQFKAEQLQFIETMPKGLIKKLTVKRMNKKDVFEESYALKMKDLKTTSEDLKSKMNGISSSILSDVNSKDDEW